MKKTASQIGYSKIFLVLPILIMSILIVSAVDNLISKDKPLNPFGIEKQVWEHKEYPRIKLVDDIVWLEFKDRADYTIINNECGFVSCKMTINATLYKKGVLFDKKIKATNVKNNVDISIDTEYYIKQPDLVYQEEVTNYTKVCNNVYDDFYKQEVPRCSNVANGRYNVTRTKEVWSKYNQEELDVGSYVVQLRGTIPQDTAIDVKPYVENIEFTEWAVWNSSFSNGLTRWYTFNESSGTTAQDLVFSRNVTIANANQWNTTACVVGNCIDFDGSTNYGYNATSITDLPLSNNNRSIVFWFRSDVASANDDYFITYGNGFANSESWFMRYGYSTGVANHLGIMTWVTEYEAQNTGMVKDIWYHVAYVYNGTSVLIYVNGALNATGALTATTTNKNRLILGARDYQGGTIDGYANVKLDELGFYNRTLTASEILDLYQNNLTYGNTAGTTPTTFNSVSLDNPTNNLVFTSEVTPTQWFNASASMSGNITAVNATLYVWNYQSKALLYTNFTNVLPNNKSNFSMRTLGDGNYSWNVNICANNGTCLQATSNSTYSVNTSAIYGYTPLTDCQTINVAGNYFMANNITFNNTVTQGQGGNKDTCFYISTDNVVFNGMNKKLILNTTTSSQAISGFYDGDSPHNNVTIINIDGELRLDYTVMLNQLAMIRLRGNNQHYENLTSFDTALEIYMDGVNNTLKNIIMDYLAIGLYLSPINNNITNVTTALLSVQTTTNASVNITNLTFFDPFWRTGRGKITWDFVNFSTNVDDYNIWDYNISIRTGVPLDYDILINNITVLMNGTFGTKADKEQIFNTNATISFNNLCPGGTCARVDQVDVYRNGVSCPANVCVNRSFDRLLYNGTASFRVAQPLGYEYSIFLINASYVNITYPRSVNYSYVPTAINYTYNTTAVTSCWYSTNSGVTNTTITCGQNITGLTANQGYNTWSIYVNDSNGVEDTSSKTFYVDSITPVANITYPINNSVVSSFAPSINLTINFTVVETGDTNLCFYNVNNGANTTVACRTNTTYLFSNGTNTINYYVNDTAGNLGSSTLSFIVDYVPIVNITTSCVNNPLYTFILYDEENLTGISGNFEYRLTYGYLNSSSILVNGSATGTNISICTNATGGSTIIIGDLEIFYNSENYVDRRYYLFDNTTAIAGVNVTVPLYDLLTASQTSFKLEVEDTSLNAYDGVYSHLLRWYPALSEYKTVDIGKTDETGSTVIHVKSEDVDYRIGIYYTNGTLIYLAAPIRMVCLVSPCTYTLKISPGETDYTSFLGVSYTFDYNETTGIWSYIYSDSSGSTSSMNLTVWRELGDNTYPVCSQYVTGTAGALTCNTSIYTTGNLRGEVYRAASPPVQIVQKIVSLYSTAFKGSGFGLFLSALIVIPIMFLLAFVSPVAAIVGGVIALIPALYFGGVNITIVGGFAVIGGIIAHFLKRIG